MEALLGQPFEPGNNDYTFLEAGFEFLQGYFEYEFELLLKDTHTAASIKSKRPFSFEVSPLTQITFLNFYYGHVISSNQIL